MRHLPTPAMTPRPPATPPPGPWARNRASNAFTLVEMLIVVGMLGILMSVSFSGIGQARTQARITRANAEVRELIAAWLSYEAAWDDWPVAISGTEIDATEAALKELMGDNPQREVYLNATMINGAFRDPWGTPYRFRLINLADQNPVTENFGAAVTFPNRHRPLR